MMTFRIHDDQDYEKFSINRPCYRGAIGACRQFQLASLVFRNSYYCYSYINILFVKYNISNI